MKKSIVIILIVLLLGVFAFSAWQVLDTLQEYRVGEKFYEEMDQYISVPEPTEKKRPFWEKENPAEETLPEEPTEPAWPEVDFASLQEINKDVVGWIYIPGTRVSYPIVQGKNNDRYLYRLITGEYNSAGSIFLEAGIARDFSEQNNPIYGHNMKNGTMFADVTGYKSQEFYDTHPYAMLLTPDQNYYVRVFSGYVLSEWGDAWETAFSEEGFEKWLKNVERKSYFAADDVIPTTEDRILTFSTCTYETDNVRFVVHGVLEEYIPEDENAAE